MGGAFTLGALAMLCDLGIGAALMGGDRGCEVPVPADVVGWWVQRVSLSKSTQPKPTIAVAATPAAVFPVSLGSSGTASSYFIQKRGVPLWCCGASPADLTVIPGASLASGRDVGSGCNVISIGESVLVTLQCCGLGRLGTCGGLGSLVVVVLGKWIELDLVGCVVCFGIEWFGVVGCPGVGGRAGGRGKTSTWYGGTMSTFWMSCRMPTMIGNIQYSCRPAELYWFCPSQRDFIGLMFFEPCNPRAVVHWSQQS